MSRGRYKGGCCLNLNLAAAAGHPTRSPQAPIPQIDNHIGLPDLGSPHAVHTLLLEPWLTFLLFMGGQPMKYVTIKKLAELTGYSEDAIRAKIKKGIWRMGEHWIKARDGRIHVIVEAIERWIEG